jgi:hypothetical protein
VGAYAPTWLGQGNNPIHPSARFLKLQSDPILLLLVFDWALIVISSLLGAGFIVQQIPHQPSMNGILLTVLVIGGIAVQAQMMRRGSRAA